MKRANKTDNFGNQEAACGGADSIRKAKWASQAQIDLMRSLRAQGLTYKAISQRVGVSLASAALHASDVLPRGQRGATKRERRQPKPPKARKPVVRPYSPLGGVDEYCCKLCPGGTVRFQRRDGKIELTAVCDRCGFTFERSAFLCSAPHRGGSIVGSRPGAWTTDEQRYEAADRDIHQS